jgi:hypothetical protein
MKLRLGKGGLDGRGVITDRIFSSDLSFLIDELLLGKLSETVAVFGNSPHICLHFGWSQRGSAISGPPVVRQQDGSLNHPC